jgi:hypothetical protein
LNERLNLNDEIVRRIKADKNNLSPTDFNTQLEKAQAKKEEMIDRTVNNFLAGSLRTDGMSKLKDFIDSEVKENIQIIPKPKSRNKDEVAFIKISGKSSRQTSNNLYLYSTAWQVGMDVYGSGSLSEEYTSETSYKVIVTVTSPSGRSNTTESDWDYARVSHETGLSIGVEDGNYTVQAEFEQAEGYYDEYKNLITTGSIGIGNALNSVTVAPFVALTFAQLRPFSCVGSGDNANVFVKIFSTAGVRNGTIVVIELNETDSTTIPYTVTDLEESGQNEPLPRTVRRVITNPGNTKEGDLFRINVGQTSDTGQIKNHLRIDRAYYTPPNGTTTAVANDTRFLDVILGVRLPPNGGGGSGGGNPTGNCFCANSGLLNPNDGTGCDGGGGMPCPPGSTGSNGICCWYSSPIVLDIDGNGYAMTSYQNSVQFDVSGRGWTTQTSWTSADSDEAWLALDRNRNGRIDSGKELFDDACEQPAGTTPRNCFSALAMFDTVEKGGNGDGKITRRDRVFKRLRLWQDRNHNGVSEPEEMFRLPALDVVALFLDYQESGRVDRFGNRFKYRARVRDRTLIINFFTSKIFPNLYIWQPTPQFELYKYPLIFRCLMVERHETQLFLNG